MTDLRSLVAVLYFNKAELTRKALNSVLAGGISPKQVVAADNGSEEKNSLSIRRWFPGISHLRREKNSGYSGGFNLVADFFIKSRFEYLLFLTNDVLYLKGALPALEEFPSRLFQVPLILNARNKERVDSFGGVINWDDYSLNHIQDLSLTEKLKPGLEYAPGTAFYIHKKTLEKIGKMDTAFHTYWEDVDFSMRAHRDGIPIFRNPEAKLLHGIGKTCHKKPFYSLFLYQRNRLKFFERYLSPEEFSLAAEKIKPELENLYAQWSGRGDKNRVAMLEEIFSLYYGAAKNG